MMMRNLSTTFIILLCVFSLGGLLDPTGAQQDESVIKQPEDAGRGIFVFPSSDDEYDDQVESDVIGEGSAPSATIRNPPPRYGRKSPNRQSGRYPYVDTFLQALEPFLHLDVDVSPNSFFGPDVGYNVHHHHHHHNPNEVPFYYQHPQSGPLPHKQQPQQQQNRPPKRVPPQQHPQKQQSFKFPTEKPQQRPTQPQRPLQRPPHQPSNNNKHPSVVFNKPPIKLYPGSFLHILFFQTVAWARVVTHIHIISSSYHF